jgi:phosphomannomutase
MKRTMIDSDAVFGAALSGHFYFRDNGGSESSLLALVAVLNLLADGNQPLGKRIATLCRYAASGPRHFRNDQPDAALAKLSLKYADARPDTLDGITVQYPDWWFHVEKSETDPLLRLHLEACTAPLLDQKLAELTPLLGEPQA